MVLLLYMFYKFGFTLRHNSRTDAGTAVSIAHAGSICQSVMLRTAGSKLTATFITSTSSRAYLAA